MNISFFLKPKVEHYNYDYFAGIDVTMDIRNPVGSRVTSIRYQGTELPEDRWLTLCMNNYRSSGTGGYECFRGSDIAELRSGLRQKGNARGIDAVIVGN